MCCPAACPLPLGLVSPSPHLKMLLEIRPCLKLCRGVSSDTCQHSD